MAPREVGGEPGTMVPRSGEPETVVPRGGEPWRVMPQSGGMSLGGAAPRRGGVPQGCAAPVRLWGGVASWVRATKWGSSSWGGTTS